MIFLFLICIFVSVDLKSKYFTQRVRECVNGSDISVCNCEYDCDEAGTCKTIDDDCDCPSEEPGYSCQSFVVNVKHITCFGKDAEDIGVCGGQGQCIDENHCKCNNFLFTGSTYEYQCDFILYYLLRENLKTSAWILLVCCFSVLLVVILLVIYCFQCRCYGALDKLIRRNLYKESLWEDYQKDIILAEEMVSFYRIHNRKVFTHLNDLKKLLKKRDQEGVIDTLVEVFEFLSTEEEIRGYGEKLSIEQLDMIKHATKKYEILKKDQLGMKKYLLKKKKVYFKDYLKSLFRSAKSRKSAPNTYLEILESADLLLKVEEGLVHVDLEKKENNLKLKSTKKILEEKRKDCQLRAKWSQFPKNNSKKKFRLFGKYGDEKEDIELQSYDVSVVREARKSAGKLYNKVERYKKVLGEFEWASIEGSLAFYKTSKFKNPESLNERGKAVDYFTLVKNAKKKLETQGSQQSENLSKQCDRIVRKIGKNIENNEDWECEFRVEQLLGIIDESFFFISTPFGILRRFIDILKMILERNEDNTKQVIGPVLKCVHLFAQISLFIQRESEIEMNVTEKREIIKMLNIYKSKFNSYPYIMFELEGIRECLKLIRDTSSFVDELLNSLKLLEPGIVINLIRAKIDSRQGVTRFYNWWPWYNSFLKLQLMYQLKPFETDHFLKFSSRNKKLRMFHIRVLTNISIKLLEKGEKLNFIPDLIPGKEMKEILYHPKVQRKRVISISLSSHREKELEKEEDEHAQVMSKNVNDLLERIRKKLGKKQHHKERVIQEFEQLKEFLEDSIETIEKKRRETHENERKVRKIELGNFSEFTSEKSSLLYSEKNVDKRMSARRSTLYLDESDKILKFLRKKTEREVLRTRNIQNNRFQNLEEEDDYEEDDKKPLLLIENKNENLDVTGKLTFEDSLAARNIDPESVVGEKLIKCVLTLLHRHREKLTSDNKFYLLKFRDVWNRLQKIILSTNKFEIVLECITSSSQILSRIHQKFVDWSKIKKHFKKKKRILREIEIAEISEEQYYLMQKYVSEIVATVEFLDLSISLTKNQYLTFFDLNEFGFEKHEEAKGMDWFYETTLGIIKNKGLLLCGIGGSGKSCLLRHLACKIFFDSEFEIFPFFMKADVLADLGKEWISNIENTELKTDILVEAVVTSCEEKFASFTNSQIIEFKIEVKNILRTRPIILLIDGYDEIPFLQRQSFITLLQYMEKEEKIDILKIILTSRFVENLRTLFSSFRMIRIDKLSNEKSYELIEDILVFTESKQNRESGDEIRNEILRRFKSIKLEHNGNPLILVLLLKRLLTTDEIEDDHLKQRFHLYESLMLSSIREDKKRKIHQETSIANCSDFYIMNILSIVAYLNHVLQYQLKYEIINILNKNMEVVIDSEKWISNLKNPMENLISSLVNFSGALSSQKDSIIFSHRTIQEFFCARFLINKNKNKLLAILRERFNATKDLYFSFFGNITENVFSSASRTIDITENSSDQVSSKSVSSEASKKTDEKRGVNWKQVYYFFHNYYKSNNHKKLGEMFRISLETKKKRIITKMLDYFFTCFPDEILSYCYMFLIDSKLPLYYLGNNFIFLNEPNVVDIKKMGYFYFKILQGKPSSNRYRLLYDSNGIVDIDFESGKSFTPCIDAIDTLQISGSLIRDKSVLLKLREKDFFKNHFNSGKSSRFHFFEFSNNKRLIFCGLPGKISIFDVDNIYIQNSLKFVDTQTNLVSSSFRYYYLPGVAIPYLYQLKLINKYYLMFVFVEKIGFFDYFRNNKNLKKSTILKKDLHFRKIPEISDHYTSIFFAEKRYNFVLVLKKDQKSVEKYDIVQNPKTEEFHFIFCKRIRSKLFTDTERLEIVNLKLFISSRPMEIVLWDLNLKCKKRIFCGMSKLFPLQYQVLCHAINPKIIIGVDGKKYFKLPLLVDHSLNTQISENSVFVEQVKKKKENLRKMKNIENVYDYYETAKDLGRFQDLSPSSVVYNENYLVGYNLMKNRIDVYIIHSTDKSAESNASAKFMSLFLGKSEKKPIKSRFECETKSIDSIEFLRHYQFNGAFHQDHHDISDSSLDIQLFLVKKVFLVVVNTSLENVTFVNLENERRYFVRFPKLSIAVENSILDFKICANRFLFFGKKSLIVDISSLMKDWKDSKKKKVNLIEKEKHKSGVDLIHFKLKNKYKNLEVIYEGYYSDIHSESSKSKNDTKNEIKTCEDRTDFVIVLLGKIVGKPLLGRIQVFAQERKFDEDIIWGVPTCRSRDREIIFKPFHPHNPTYFLNKHFDEKEVLIFDHLEKKFHVLNWVMDLVVSKNKRNSKSCNLISSCTKKMEEAEEMENEIMKIENSKCLEHCKIEDDFLVFIILDNNRYIFCNHFVYDLLLAKKIVFTKNTYICNVSKTQVLKYNCGTYMFYYWDNRMISSSFDLRVFQRMSDFGITNVFMNYFDPQNMFDNITDIDQIFKLKKKKKSFLYDPIGKNEGGGNGNKALMLENNQVLMDLLGKIVENQKKTEFVVKEQQNMLKELMENKSDTVKFEELGDLNLKIRKKKVKEEKQMDDSKKCSIEEDNIQKETEEEEKLYEMEKEEGGEELYDGFTIGGDMDFEHNFFEDGSDDETEEEEESEGEKETDSEEETESTDDESSEIEND